MNHPARSSSLRLGRGAGGRGYSLRKPQAEDGAAIWALVRDSDTLDTNSPYAYLLLCSDFSGTGIVAKDADGLLGFVLGYRPPADPECVFVWQVAVAPSARGRGVAGAMLDAVFAAQQAADVRFLRATVTPSNAASRALFRAFARRHRAPWREQLAFRSGLFPGEGHEDEIAICIGPVSPTQPGTKES